MNRLTTTISDTEASGISESDLQEIQSEINICLNLTPSEPVTTPGSSADKLQLLEEVNKLLFDLCPVEEHEAILNSALDVLKLI
jgi:hypothetical protein